MSVTPVTDKSQPPFFGIARGRLPPLPEWVAELPGLRHLGYCPAMTWAPVVTIERSEVTDDRYERRIHPAAEAS